MKFLECSNLESLSSTIQNNAVDCQLDIKIENYSCKMVQSDKKQWKKEYEQVSTTRQALSPSEEELGVSPKGRRLRHLSERDSDEGTFLVDSISPRTLFDLITLLNTTFPDYEFSDRQGSDFSLVNSFESLQQRVDERMAAVVFDYTRIKNDFWTSIRNEIKPEECLIYTYNCDYTGDPFTEDGCVWSYNYFLHNKNLKRLLFLSCRALSLADPNLSSDQLFECEY